MPATGQDESEWTLNTLKIHLEEMINSNENLSVQRHNAEHNAVALALTSQQALVDQAQRSAIDAVRKAEIATEKRFESVNEFRAQLGDQARTFIPRLEYDSQYKNLTVRIESLELRLTELAGRKAGVAEGWAKPVAIMGVVMIILSFVIAFATFFGSVTRILPQPK